MKAAAKGKPGKGNRHQESEQAIRWHFFKTKEITPKERQRRSKIVASDIAMKEKIAEDYRKDTQSWLDKYHVDQQPGKLVSFDEKLDAEILQWKNSRQFGKFFLMGYQQQLSSIDLSEDSFFAWRSVILKGYELRLKKENH